MIRRISRGGNCSFEHVPILHDANLVSLALGGSRLPGLDARGLHVRADLQLCDGFRCDGAIHLERATIGGNLWCNGAVIGNGSAALTIDDALVGGHLLLSNGCEVRGATSLRRTRDKGHALWCARQAGSSGPIALAAEDLVVDRDVIMGLGFRANGELDMRRAHIGGFWYCAHGSFVNPGKMALRADRATNGNPQSSANHSDAKGVVSLVRMQISGELNCVGGIFQNAGGDALRAEGLRMRAATCACIRGFSPKVPSG